MLLQEISTLRESVDLLHSTVQEQNQQINTLKGNRSTPVNHTPSDPCTPTYTDDMIRIQKRLSESGADFRTERELKQVSILVQLFL